MTTTSGDTVAEPMACWLLGFANFHVSLRLDQQTQPVRTIS
jgi:hypothetical protein